MSKKLFFLLPMLALIMAAGCKKEKKNNPIGNRFYLTSGSGWRLTDMKDNGKHVALGCKDDDLWVFSEGGRGYKSDGENRCGDAEESGTTEYYWSITGDQRYLYIDNYKGKDYGVQEESLELDWEIAYMTNNELDIKYYSKNGEDSHFYELQFTKVQ